MSIQRVELDEYTEQVQSGNPLLNPDISLISNVQIKLDIKVGDADITVEDLFELTKGSILQMNQLIDEPVRVCLDGKIVARGELVAVDDAFGVKITEIQNAKD